MRGSYREGIDFRIEQHDTGRIIARLDEFPQHLQHRIRAEILEITGELLPAVRAQEPVRTGELRRLTQRYVDEKPGWVRGRVRVITERVAIRAGALEYGAPGKRRKGPVNVRAHTRRGFHVAAFERRRPRIEAMRFLRGPAAAQLPRARARLRAVIGEAWIEVRKERGRWRQIQ